MPISDKLIRHIYDTINDYYNENWREASGCKIKLKTLIASIRDEETLYENGELELIEELKIKTDKNLLTIIKQWITKFNKLRKKWDIKSSIKEEKYLDFTGMSLPEGLP